MYLHTVVAGYAFPQEPGCIILCLSSCFLGYAFFFNITLLCLEAGKIPHGEILHLVKLIWQYTLYQLFASVREGDPQLEIAKDLLFMPDLFIHALCGAQVCERTIASTSQMQDARTGALIERETARFAAESGALGL